MGHTVRSLIIQCITGRNINIEGGADVMLVLFRVFHYLKIAQYQCHLYLNDIHYNLRSLLF